MRTGGQHAARRHAGWTLTACAALLLILAPASSAFAQGPQRGGGQSRSFAQPQSSQPRSAPSSHPSQMNPGPQQFPGRGQQQMGQQGRNQHLPEWMERHNTLNPSQQEQALRREPGFNRLPPQQQQHLIERLRNLDNAPPQVRQRILARNEIFEHLPPERQQEIRGASQALSQMPPERNQAVRHAFHDLRGLPPDQRINVLNSARFQAEFTPQERNILGHLLSIEPYQP